MPAAATGKFTHVGSPHWTSGPLAVIPVGLHDAWKAEFGKSDSVTLGKMKKRVVLGETGGVFFARTGEAGCFVDGSTVVLVEAVDLEGRRAMPPIPVLQAANQVELEPKTWKHVADYRVEVPHVLWNASAKALQGEAVKDRQKAIAVPLAFDDYVIEEARGVPFAVKAFPNKAPVQVKYSFTRLRPASAAPVAKAAAKPELPPVASELVATPDLIAAAKKLKFVDSDQTAMVILPRAALPAWSGLGGDGADYWRACGVKDVGLIASGMSKTKALAIGMDSAMSFHATATGGLVLMWVGADSAAGVLTLALSIPEKRWKKTRVRWDVGDGKLVMIGAPTVGKKAGRARVDLDLPRGTYRVDACWGFAGDVRVAKQTESVGISALRLTRV